MPWGVRSPPPPPPEPSKYGIRSVHDISFAIRDTGLQLGAHK